MSKQTIITEIHKALLPVRRAAHQTDYRTLIHAVGDAKIVMIGEASHGTEEFYQHRAEITKQLIEQKGFNIVCAEGINPNVLRNSRY